MRQSFSRTYLQSLCAGRDFHWHFTPARGKSGGLLLGVNYTTLDVISQDEGDYHIKMTVQDLKTWNDLGPGGGLWGSSARKESYIPC